MSTFKYATATVVGMTEPRCISTGDHPNLDVGMKLDVRVMVHLMGYQASEC